VRQPLYLTTSTLRICCSICSLSIAPITKTAVLKILLDILRALDSGDLAVLPLLDLDAAFNTEEVVWTQRSCARLVPVSSQWSRWSTRLRVLHWLRVPQRIESRLAVLVYRCLNGTVPQYLADGSRVADISSRTRLRSVSTALLHVPRSKHKTIGDRAFPVAAAKVWNSLPPSITSLSSLLQFRKALKTDLF